LAIDWEAALSEHHRWLRAVVYSRLRDCEAVDDVMQEVALAAVRQQAPLADPGKVAPWLYRVAIRQSLLYRRTCGRRRKLLDRYQHVSPAATGPATNPLDWLLSDERQVKVRRALQQLPRRDVEMLLLKYQENWSYRDIAGRLGLSESAVEARLHRARGRLRDQLARMEPEGDPRR
jgi:RNA polymerase sigma-70 factor (ECF subfamily)